MDREACISSDIYGFGVPARCFCPGGYLFDCKFKVLGVGSIYQHAVCDPAGEFQHLWALCAHVDRYVSGLKSKFGAPDFYSLSILRNFFP